MHRVSTSTILCQPLIPANKWGFQKSWNTPPTHKHTHSKELLSDPHATGALVRCKERSPTAFLAPDGFVQPPWKPHTPRLHWRSASSSEEEQRTRQRALFAGDIFISPLCSGVRLTCSLFISSVLSLYPDMFYFTRSQTSSFSARSLIWCKETIPTKSGLNRLKLLCMQPSERRLIHPEMLKVKVVNASRQQSLRRSKPRWQTTDWSCAHCSWEKKKNHRRLKATSHVQRKVSLRVWFTAFAQQTVVRIWIKLVCLNPNLSQSNLTSYSWI